MKAYVVFALLTILCFKGLAGNDKGSGGDGIVCFDEQGGISSVKLLDFYGDNNNPFLRPYFGETPLRVLDKVNYALIRLLDVGDTRANNYLSWASTFINESEFVDELPEIYDYGIHTVHLPENCRIEQLAIQRVPVTVGQPRYQISRKLWNHLDDDNRAGLIVHELIYRGLLERGWATSYCVRAISRAICSMDMEYIRRYHLYDNYKVWMIFHEEAFCRDDIYVIPTEGN